MIYSNDETDKAKRKKNYLLNVFLLPIGVGLTIAASCFIISHKMHVSRFDLVFGYYFALIAGFLIYGINKCYWLKMPDGTFHNIKAIAPINKVSLNEPNEYEEVYFVRKQDKIISIVMGIFMITAAIFVGIKHVRGILLPIFFGGIGVFMLYTGIRALLDKTPRLKLAKHGIWTAKLGFVDWNDITKTQVIVDKSGRSPQTILEIYLKGTVFAEANQPDERLLLTAIENKEYIETVINNLIFKRNELAA